MRARVQRRVCSSYQVKIVKSMVRVIVERHFKAFILIFDKHAHQYTYMLCPEKQVVQCILSSQDTHRMNWWVCSTFYVAVNLHYKSHPNLNIYLLLKSRDFSVCVAMKWELPFSSGLSQLGLRHKGSPGTCARPVCVLWIEDLRLEGCHPGTFHQS